MLAGLQDEITVMGLNGVAPRIVMTRLNKPGTAITEAVVVAPYEVLITKSELTTYHLSGDSFEKLIDFMETDSGKYVKARWNDPSMTKLDLSASLVRSLITDLCTAEICTEAERDNLLAMGMIKKSRAEELTETAEGVARYITLEDFE